MEKLPRLESSRARSIAEKLKTISGGRVLDVCTGDGGFISTLTKTLGDFKCFVGIDLSDKGLELASNKSWDHPVQFMKMNAEDLQYEDDSFDTVCMANSLHELDRPAKVLNELKRVLSLGGHLVIEEMYGDGDQDEAQVTDIIAHHWNARIDRLLGETHNNTFTKDEISDAVRNLGLRELEILDSSRRVKCLFCSQRFECENPRSKRLVDDLAKNIDKGLDRVKQRVEFEELKAQGERIKERAREVGVADASILFIVGVK